jgi:hypothetical protein
VIALQASAALMALVAIGFGGPTPFVALHLLRERKLPIFMGMFPMYGGGLASSLTPEAFTVVLAVFAALSAIELFAAILLWEGIRLGAVMVLTLLPFEIAFWVLFALPFPPLLAVLRLVLLWPGWAALR